MTGTRRHATPLLLLSVLLGCATSEPSAGGIAPTPAATPAASPSATPEPPGPPSTAPSPVTDRQDDLELLVTLFRNQHPGGFDLAGELADVGARAATVTADEFLTAVMTAAAGRERDGHSGVFPLAQRDLDLWPLQLYDFDDSWRVVAASPAYDHLVGREVTRVGGVPVGAAAERVAPLVPADNDASRRGRLPQYLVVPAVLEGVGLEASLEIGGEPVRPETVTADEYADRFGIFYPLVCPPLPRADPSMWSLEARDGAVIVRFARVVFRDDDGTVEQLAAEATATIERTDPDRVVLDLRDNPGGELPAGRPLVAALRQVAADRPGALRILVNRCTFSAAALMTSELAATTDAVIVGEPMGGSPGIWADARPYSLPDSGIVVHVASRWYEPVDPGLPATLAPDVPVAPTWSDHAAGRDRALEAALGG